LDIPQVYPDSVSNFEWRNWKVSRRGVDLILFEGTRYLVTKIQMELLEICHNLMSSIRQNRFKDTSSLG